LPNTGFFGLDLNFNTKDLVSTPMAGMLAGAHVNLLVKGGNTHLSKQWIGPYKSSIWTIGHLINPKR